MRILLVSDVYKYYTSGVSIVVITLAYALRSAGHEVRVLSLSNNRKSFRQGEDFYISSMPSVLYPKMRSSFVRSHPYIDDIIRWKPEVIHLHTEGSVLRFAGKIARRTGAPIVMTYHTDYATYAFHGFSRTPPVHLLMIVLAWYYFRRAAVVTVPSEKGKRLLESYHLRKEIRVVPNGIILDRFQKKYTDEERSAVFEKLGIPDNGKLFVIISRISAEKNIQEILHYFIQVIERDREAHLMITGDGPYMSRLEKLAARLGLSENVIFTGAIPQEKLYQYYKAGIAFLSASTFEMQGLTYLEAMACGLPLICREDPCLAGVLKDGYNGYSYQTKEEFLERCTELMENPGQREKFSEAALKMAQFFDHDSLAGHMVKLYQEISSRSEYRDGPQQ